MIPHLIRKVHSPQTWRDQTEAKRRLYSRRLRSSSAGGKNQKTKKGRLKKLFFFLIILAVLFFLSATIVVAWIARDLPSPDKLIERQLSQSTKIFDRTGTHLLYEVYNQQRRTLIDLKDIPEYAKWATILVEDKNFYQHGGVAWLSILRAQISNLLNRSTGRGGASTLTQQLVKNAILNNEHSYIRKIKEAILAKEIERKYSKDEILKMYFNEIPYGSTNYGIEATAQSFLGKSAKDLTVNEAAILAALPQAPTKYLNNLDKLKVRRDFILDLLVENNKIQKDQAESAKKEPIKINRSGGLLTAPHFVLYVKEILSEKYGEKMVESGGLQVITTLDYDLQKIAEEEVKTGAEKNEKKYKANNAALVAMDPKTGQILAMVGSRDFDNEEIDGQVNVALRPRQPGSSFKPLVYAAAFEKGLTPDTKVYDVETVFKTETKDFIPHDYDGKERGLVTLRQALAGSLNIPAVKTLYLTGIDKILELAQKMGYTTLSDRSRFGLALVLGGAEVKLLEHVHGFAVLANEGENLPTTTILEIKDAQGNILEKFTEPTRARVIEQQPVRRLIDIMSDNNARAYIFGEQNSLTLPDRPVAAKTGTTNDWHDGWTLGFTPSLVTGVWTGNNNNKPMAKNADGVYTAGPIWHNFMARALKNKPIEGFNPPDPYPENIKPILIGQGMGEVSVKVNKLNNKLATETTPFELIENRIYRQPHSLLYYLNRDDILGPAPTDPNLDPQFATWEEGVKNWAIRQGISSDQIPTELDNGAVLATNIPKVSIVSPTANQTLAERDLVVTTQMTNEQSIEKVNFYLDDELIETKTTAPFNFQTHLYETSQGFHNIKIRAITADGTYSEAGADFNLTAPDEPPNISWAFPSDNESIYRIHFPVSLKIKLYQIEKIKKIDISLTREAGQTKILTTLTDPTEKTTIIPWNKPPEIGIYTLKSQITTFNGQNYAGAKRGIEIK